MEESKNIIILFVGLILGLAFLMTLANISQNMINEITGSTSDNDTNFTEGYNELSILSTYPDASCSDIEIFNSTDGEEIIGEGNYTFYPSNCSYIAQTDSIYINELVNISYNYSYESSEYIDSQTARTMINILIVLFSLSILGFLISYLVKKLS